jgi:hypothetical protein
VAGASGIGVSPVRRVWHQDLIRFPDAIAAEDFFAKLTTRRLKRGVFHSLANIQAAIGRFLAETNNTPPT